MKADLQYQSLKPEDVIETDPPTCCASGTVIKAISQMDYKDGQGSRRSSYILILSESKLVGILTEPDIVRLTATNIDLSKTKIDEVMTTEVITLKKSEFIDINTIMMIMRHHQIRYLPIVDDFGALQGLVSVHTICQALHPSNLLKFRRVEEAMTTKLQTASRKASILSLSQIMAENRCSCIVIIESDKSTTFPELIADNYDNLMSFPVGIVTERDIVQFQILGLDLANTTTETIMSTPLVCMKTTDSLMAAQKKMEELRVRRLVIVGEQGNLQGIITQFNMLKVLDPAELFGVIETLQSELEVRTSQLQQEKELAQVTLQSIGDAVITTDAQGEIINLNSMAEKLTGYNSQEINKKSLADVFCIINQQTRESIKYPVVDVLQGNQISGLANNTILISRNGQEYAIEDSASPILDNNGQIIGAVIVFRDVTESRNLNQKISWQANHDALTGLYNRREFEQRLLKTISAASNNEEHSHAMCYLDLDRFKIINDTCGHLAGDTLLLQITKLMSQQVRVSDTLARLGGDEFGLLLHQCPMEVAISIANSLREKIENFNFSWQNRTFSIGVSIGLVEITPNTKSLSSLMNTADAACYIAKANGRNYVHVHRDNDVELSKNLGQRQWIVQLNQALKKDHFCLYAQKIAPIQNLSDSDRIEDERYEILLRLRNQHGEIISPNTFLSAAENYNLMPAIDRWVITNFMSRYDSYYRHNSNNKTAQNNRVYSINLSGASINSKSFHLFLRQQFDKYQILPNNICFEITETVAISNLKNAAKFIQELRELGCSIALDDFGSGMSSLTYLENLTIDYLKIDGSFVKKIAHSEVAWETVKYFNHIAQIMNIQTVAEFVENENILQLLQNINVSYAQGYGIAKPKPLIFN